MPKSTKRRAAPRQHRPRKATRRKAPAKRKRRGLLSRRPQLKRLKHRVAHGGPLPKLVYRPELSPGAICRLIKSRRRLNVVTVEDSHGNKVQLQAVAARSFLRAKARLERQKIGLLVASSGRTCDDQCRICKSICGECVKGCPGYCACKWCSGHLWKICVDVVAGGRKRPYKKIRAAFLAEGWHNFSQATDPNHFSKTYTL